MKDFFNDFYKEILCSADDDANVDTLIVFLKNGDRICASGSIRLCQVGITKAFVIIEGTLNDSKKECQYYVPHDNINFIEIKNTDKDYS